MKNSQIAQILHVNKSTVSRILKGSKNYSKYKIERCMFYKNFELDVVEDTFKAEEFADICEFVISKTTNRDAKNYDDIIRFATQCTRWNEVLYNNKDLSKLDGLMVASLNKEPMDLFCDQLFWEMLNIVVKKCKNSAMRQRASILQDSSINIRRVKR